MWDFSFTSCVQTTSGLFQLPFKKNQKLYHRRKVETCGAKLTTQTHLGHRSSLPHSLRPYILLTFRLIIKAPWCFHLKNAVFWDMTPCSLLWIYLKLWVACSFFFWARVQIYASLYSAIYNRRNFVCSHHRGNIKSIDVSVEECSSETSRYFDKSTMQHNLEENLLFF